MSSVCCVIMCCTVLHYMRTFLLVDAISHLWCASCLVCKAHHIYSVTLSSACMSLQGCSGVVNILQGCDKLVTNMNCGHKLGAEQNYRNKYVVAKVSYNLNSNSIFHYN